MGAHGEVYSGCFAFKPIGSLRERNLKEIIDSEEYKERLYNMLLKRCPGCNYALNLFYYIPSVCEEMLWSIGLKDPKSVS